MNTRDFQQVRSRRARSPVPGGAAETEAAPVREQTGLLEDAAASAAGHAVPVQAGTPEEQNHLKEKESEGLR
ncbi:hypothetical protein [[Pseudopropionibacterium] massiliense]|uniref:hypothetical protein n=1 Tax=[Pseudopropionibacterium] massiliense TaxID=2220000 RepID=UPI0010321563|nr:hypothetical protein [[Pseudopropionibacterium] massiliense]